MQWRINISILINNKTHNRKTKRQGSVKHKQSKKKFPWRHEFNQNLKEYVMPRFLLSFSLKNLL